MCKYMCSCIGKGTTCHQWRSLTISKVLAYTNTFFPMVNLFRNLFIVWAKIAQAAKCLDGLGLIPGVGGVEIFLHSRLICMYIWGFKVRQYLRSLAPVMKVYWWLWWPNYIWGPCGPKAPCFCLLHSGGRPDWSWGPLSLLWNEYRGLSPGVKAAECRTSHPTSS